MENLPINSVDMVVIAVVLLSGLLALFRGFVKEVLSVGSWIGAGVVALYGFSYVQPFAREQIGSDLIADVAAGAGLFTAALVLFTVLTHWCSSLVQDGAAGAIDRSLGFGFGVLRGAVIVSLGVIVLDTLVPDRTQQPDWALDARTRPWLDDGARVLLGLIPGDLRQQLPEMSDELGNDVDAIRGGVEQIQRLNEAREGLRNSFETKDDAQPAQDGYNDAEREQQNDLFQQNQ